MIRNQIFIFFYVILMVFILSGCNRSAVHNKEISNTNNAAAMEEEMRQAALNGDADHVKKFIDAGTDVNAMNQEGHTALMLAAYNGHTEIVTMLIDMDAVVDRRDLLGQTALLYASSGQFPETVRILLDKGAEPNIVDSNEHFSPLMHAATAGNLDAVKLLLEYGADRLLTDVDGDNAEFFARQAGHNQVAEYLQSIP